MKLFLLLVAGILSTFLSQAQSKSDVKFGEISAADFTITSTLIDTSTNAIVISDIGSSIFEGNNTGWFTLVFKRFVRIKILNQKGFDAADVRIQLFTDKGYYKEHKDKEELLNLKGATYNIDNGHISVTPLDPNTVFENTLDRNWVEKKFAMPGIKAGSILEYQFTIKSDFFFHLQPWSFQGKYPCLWSEYSVHIPDCFSYISINKGYNPFFINEKKTKNEILRVEDPSYAEGAIAGSPQTYLLNSNSLTDRWVIKDVPALKQESMVYTNKNFASEINFQLNQYRFSDPPENKMQDWLTVSKELMARGDFGEGIGESPWLNNELSSFLDSSDNELTKAKKIFAYVRNNFASTETGRLYLSPDAGFRNIYKHKKGSVSDINLLLTAMLKEAGLKVSPLILSTRNNGMVHPHYPILSQYNYVICRLILNDSAYYLDASCPFLGFNKLQEKCYNGLARPINADTSAINFSPDSLKETTTTSIFMNNIDSSNNLQGVVSKTLGYNESLHLRQLLSEQPKADYFKNITENFPDDVTIGDHTIESVNQYDLPIHLKYNISLADKKDAVIYINPMLGQALKQNPFSGEEKRLYPIEMPYCTDNVYLLNLEVPAGYQIEETPKSAKIILDNDAGYFEYIIAPSDTRIQLRCRLKINKATYDASAYSNLKDFYAYIIKKESELLVFKKIDSK